MKNRYIYICAVAALLVAAVSCSPKKNTKASRFYQGLTTRFNVHFNGYESYKENLKGMQDDYKDDYTRLVHLHPVSAYGNEKEPQPSGDFERSIEKSKKAIQLHSIKKKPKRDPKKMSNPKYRAFVNREEFNPYIHNSWMLLGKSQFHKGAFLEASATFAYIIRHFTWKEDVVREARIWLMRSYLEMGWLYEAEDVLHKIGLDSVPPSLNGQLAMACADYHIRRENYAEAIPHLKASINAQKNKSQKIRQTFALAQIYALKGEKQLSYDTYAKLLKMNPVYRTALNARIKQTEVMTGGNMEKVIKDLLKMVKSSRNEEYLDQIYYAVGNIYLAQKDTAKAIENYILANEKSTRNGIEKAVNQITLGNLYFEQQRYTKAQPCYAEAIPLLDETYPDYELLSRRSTVLDELSMYAETVEVQDSLQYVASLPEEEIMALIEKKIEEIKEAERLLKEAEEREAYMQEQQAIASQFAPGFSGNAQAPTVGVMPSTSNSWYFYNPALVSAGKTDFQRKWGNRKLEDDWRRRNKAAFSMSDFEEYDYDAEDEELARLDSLDVAENAADSLDIPVSDEKDPRFYLQQLPRTEEELALSDDLIMDGLYNMGIILKNDLEDYNAAMDCFNRLETEYPDNRYRLEYYYNIYLMNMMAGNTLEAENYRQKILSDFPDSRYAQAMADPNYLENLRTMEVEQDTLYRMAYDRFLAGDNPDVHKRFDEFVRKYPLSRNMPKFMLINALAYVNERDIENFKSALRMLLERYPEEETSELATEMLKGLAQGREVVSGTGKQDIWTMRLGRGGEVAEEGAAEVELPPFEWENDVPYMMIMAFPSDTVDANLVLFLAARYNFTNFYIKDFDLQLVSGDGVGMLNIKGFSNLREIMLYRKKIEGADGMNLPDGVRKIMISEDNYQLLMNGYSFEDYQKFWDENLILQDAELYQ